MMQACDDVDYDDDDDDDDDGDDDDDDDCDDDDDDDDYGKNILHRLHICADAVRECLEALF